MNTMKYEHEANMVATDPPSLAVMQKQYGSRVFNHVKIL